MVMVSMNHVSAPMLRWLRLAFLAYSIHFLVGYGLFAFVMGKGIQGTAAFIPLIAILVGIQIIFEAIAERRLFDRAPWLTTMASFCFALFETLIAIQVTSATQSSPYFAAIAILVFLAGAVSVYLVPAIIFLLSLGVAMRFAGVQTTSGSFVTDMLLLGLTTAVGTAGFFFWRRYYVIADDPNLAKSRGLSKMLHEEQLKSNVIIDSIDDAVVLVDSKKTIRVFNPAARTISGWKGDEMMGLDYKVVLNFVDDKGKPYTPEQDPFNQVFTKGKPVHDNNATLKNHEDKSIAVTVSASPLLDSENNVTAVIGVFRDVSQQRGQEKRSADFVSTASHEMRTPVAAIEGYLALALNDRVSTIDSKARGYLEKAHESTQHLGRLFQDLLTSTKAEDGRLTNHPTVIEMSAFTEKLVEDLRFSAEKKGLRMEYVMGTPGGDAVSASEGQTVNGTKVVKPFYYVHADAERIREVITNLFDNGVKYTESGTITLGLTGNKEVVQVSVHDTGPGIPANDIPHLFQKFYRVDSTVTRTIGGTGLGLFICRKIVEMYDGRIWVESKLGEGSTFYINLPRLSNEKAKELQAQEVLTVQATAPSSTNRSTS